MQKYVIYDNYDRIYDIADTEQEIKQKWNDSKATRIIATSIDKNKKYCMGIIELSEEELIDIDVEIMEEE